MSGFGRLLVTFPITARLFVRSPAALTLCIVCLALGMMGLALVVGLRNSFEAQVSYGELSDVSILLRKGNSGELTSSLEDAEVEALRTYCTPPGCVFAPQLMLGIADTRAESPTGASVVMRGVERFDAIPNVEITLVEGRYPEAGKFEAAVGRALATSSGLHVGDTLEARNQIFTIVGMFEAANGPLDVELMAYAEQLRATGMTGWSSVWTSSADAAKGLTPKVVQEVGRDNIIALSAREFYEGQFGGLRRTFTRLILGVSLLVLVSTVAAYVLTLGNVLRRSAKALSIMRRIGFSQRSVIAGITVFGALLGLAAGILGLALSSLVALSGAIIIPAGVQNLALAIRLSGLEITLIALVSTILGALATNVTIRLQERARRRLTDG